MTCISDNIQYIILFMLVCLSAVSTVSADVTDDFLRDAAAVGHRDIRIVRDGLALYVRSRPMGFRDGMTAYRDMRRRVGGHARPHRVSKPPDTVSITQEAWGRPFITGTFTPGTPDAKDRIRRDYTLCAGQERSTSFYPSRRLNCADRSGADHEFRRLQ